VDARADLLAGGCRHGQDLLVAKERAICNLQAVPFEVGNGLLLLHHEHLGHAEQEGALDQFEDVMQEGPLGVGLAAVLLLLCELLRICLLLLYPLECGHGIKVLLHLFGLHVDRLKRRSLALTRLVAHVHRVEHLFGNLDVDALLARDHRPNGVLVVGRASGEGEGAMRGERTAWVRGAGEYWVVPGTRVCGIRYMVSGMWYQVCGIRYVVSGMWCQVCGVRYVVSGV
jgi:hypothetical protein